MIRKETCTRRLILRPIELKDYSAWLECFISLLPPRDRWEVGPKTKKQCSKTYFRAWLTRVNGRAKTDDSYWYGVFEKKSGKLIGSVDFDIYVRQSHHFANFGYQIYNRHQGHGYGQEAATAGLKIGFNDLKLNRLEAAINLDNKKSIRLAKAIGMRREGIKKRYWFEHGSWVDHLIYVANPEDVGLKPQILI